MFDQQEVICRDEVAQIGSDKMSIIAKFATQKRQILEGHIVASPFINPATLVRNMLSTQEILGIADEHLTTGKETEES